MPAELLWGVNGKLSDTAGGWQFIPPDGSPPPPARGEGPNGLALAVQDWYADIRKHQGGPVAPVSQSEG